METILTVLITLGVVAIVAAVWGVVRLNRRVDDLDVIRMEFVDLEGEVDKRIEREIDEREKLAEDFYKRLDEWNSSIDRRFDKLWTDVHNLDRIINPNKDLLK